ncbi:hypothetical protein BC829DRAFT_124381 [Chytridium lagenaria]|nr:hypothetical protein BC829DRAFT_124381 [Chytridium lagenaria]
MSKRVKHGCLYLRIVVKEYMQRLRDPKPSWRRPAPPLQPTSRLIPGFDPYPHHRLHPYRFIRRTPYPPPNLGSKLSYPSRIPRTSPAQRFSPRHPTYPHPSLRNPLARHIPPRRRCRIRTSRQRPPRHPR